MYYILLYYCISLYVYYCLLINKQLHRFNLLMSRYQNIIIQIVSDSNLNSKESLIQLINDTTTAITPLAGVFFATLVILFYYFQLIVN